MATALTMRSFPMEYVLTWVSHDPSKWTNEAHPTTTSVLKILVGFSSVLATAEKNVSMVRETPFSPPVSDTCSPATSFWANSAHAEMTCVCDGNVYYENAA